MGLGQDARRSELRRRHSQLLGDTVRAEENIDVEPHAVLEVNVLADAEKRMQRTPNCKAQTQSESEEEWCAKTNLGNEGHWTTSGKQCPEIDPESEM